MKGSLNLQGMLDRQKQKSTPYLDYSSLSAKLNTVSRPVCQSVSHNDGCTRAHSQSKRKFRNIVSSKQSSEANDLDVRILSRWPGVNHLHYTDCRSKKETRRMKVCLWPGRRYQERKRRTNIALVWNEAHTDCCLMGSGCIIIGVPMTWEAG